MEKLQTKLENYEKQICKTEFMKMNKKENEIIILRAENSNLKSSIASMEKNLENFKIKIENLEKKIKRKEEKITYLSKKMTQMEETMLLEGLQTSIDKENLKKFTTNNEFTNNLLSRSKEIKEKEYSIKDFISIKEKIDDFENEIPIYEKEKLLDFIQNQSSNEKTNCSSDKKNFSKKTPKENDLEKVFANIFDKINTKNNIQSFKKEKKSLRNFSKKNVKKIS
jgi:hypothetical protein